MSISGYQSCAELRTMLIVLKLFLKRRKCTESMNEQNNSHFAYELGVSGQYELID